MSRPKRRQFRFRGCDAKQKVFTTLAIVGPINEAVGVYDQLELDGYCVLHAGYQPLPGDDGEIDLSRFAITAIKELATP